MYGLSLCFLYHLKKGFSYITAVSFIRWSKLDDWLALLCLPCRNQMTCYKVLT